MIYLDNAATSYPKPPGVARAVRRALDTCASPGRGAYSLSRTAAGVVYDAREKLCELFGAKNPEQIVFCQNATMAINTALFGALRPRDRFLVTSMEHNSVIRPAKRLEGRGARLVVIRAGEDGIVDPEAVRARLDRHTRLLCVIHASNVSGSVNDIEAIGKIAKDFGVLFMVDASQSAGLLPIDVKRAGIDLLAFPGHKALLGPAGTGGLYVGERVKLAPLLYGGTGSVSESFLQPDFMPDRLEAGTLNVPGIAGLSAGVDFILRHTPEAICEHERELVKVLMEDLSVIPGVTVLGTPDLSRRAGAVAVKTTKDTSDVAAMLDCEYGICVRAGLHCAPMAHKTLGSFDSGAVRFSPGVFTTKAEIKRAAWAMERIMK